MESCADLLHDAYRLVASDLVWGEHASVAFPAKRWIDLLPIAAASLLELGWWTEDRGATIRRRDQCGYIRSFAMGVDGLSILFQWLRDWRWRYLLRK